MNVDYLIVGAGMYGSVIAQQLNDAGKRVAVVDSRNHIGGICYTEPLEHIILHMFGPHIFHTNNQRVWKYMNTYAAMKPYVHTVRVHVGGVNYPFPINLDTMGMLMGLRTPRQAKAYFKTAARLNVDTTNAEGWLISQVGPFLYDKFYKGYTEKFWGRPAKEVPASVIKRIPIRTNYDGRYHSSWYSGIPVGGYTPFFERVLDGIPVSLETPYPDCLDDFKPDHTVYSGPIDAFFGNTYGKLEYRSLRFDIEKHHTDDYQGCAQVNYPEKEKAYTRITEHKHFDHRSTPYTFITKEFPMDEGDPYYPVTTDDNVRHYQQYTNLAHKEKRVTFGGRLGTYQYLNMDQVIAVALQTAERLLRR